jgi:predicted MPP superfamily phosphohydrolase
MARLVHLSDLHFGAHDEDLVEAVERKVDTLKPELVVVSGERKRRSTSYSGTSWLPGTPSTS